MGFMDFTGDDPVQRFIMDPEERARVEAIVGVTAEEVRNHVDYLLANNTVTNDDGRKQFEYLLNLTPVEMALVIGGLLGHIAKLNNRYF